MPPRETSLPPKRYRVSSAGPLTLRLSIILSYTACAVPAGPPQAAPALPPASPPEGLALAVSPTVLSAPFSVPLIATATGRTATYSTDWLGIYTASVAANWTDTDPNTWPLEWAYVPSGATATVQWAGSRFAEVSAGVQHVVLLLCCDGFVRQATSNAFTIVVLPPSPPSLPLPRAPPIVPGAPLSSSPPEMQQWATYAISSSEFSRAGYSARQATGPADVAPSCTTSPDSWTKSYVSYSIGAGGWLQLGFRQAVKATLIEIFETHDAPFVKSVEVIDSSGNSTAVFSGPDTTACGSALQVALPRPLEVKQVRVHTLEAHDWPEIDAVRTTGIPIEAEGFTFDFGSPTSNGWTTGSDPSLANSTPPYGFARCQRGPNNFDRVVETYYYYYASTSGNRVAGDLFTLSYNGSMCASSGQVVATVAFGYAMFGWPVATLVGTLRLVDAAGRTAWSRSGDQGSSWQLAKVALFSPAFRFEYVHLSNVGHRQYTGLLELPEAAVAQVRLTCAVAPPSSPLSPPSPPRPPPFAPETVFDFSSPNSNGWSTGSDPTSDISLPPYAFYRQRGGTKTANTGPDAGISALGYYYFAETDVNLDEGSDPYMLSYNGSACASSNQVVATVGFSYHMHGVGIGTLRLIDAADQTAWIRNLEQGSKWHQARVTLFSPAFRFEYVRSIFWASRNRGDAALAQVELTCGVAPHPPPPSLPPPPAAPPRRPPAIPTLWPPLFAPPVPTGRPGPSSRPPVEPRSPPSPPPVQTDSRQSATVVGVVSAASCTVTLLLLLWGRKVLKKMLRRCASSRFGIVIARKTRPHQIPLAEVSRFWTARDFTDSSGQTSSREAREIRQFMSIASSATPISVASTMQSASPSDVPLPDPEANQTKVVGVPLLNGHEIEIGQVLGKGGFATVYRARWQGAPVAVKVLKEKVLEAKAAKEANLLAQFRHPCICTFYGMCMQGNASCLVLELMEGGTLAQFVYDANGHTSTRYKEMMAADASQAALRLLKLSLQVADGLRFLHANHVAHKDIKCSNVLLDASHSTARVADFGLSNASATPSYEPRQMGSEARSTGMGTLRYSPPELSNSSNRVVAPTEKQRFARDIYSYGMLLHEILHGARTFNELSSLEAFSAATKGLRPPIDLTTFPAEYHCLSHVNEQCWDSRSNKRPSAQEVVATLLALLRRVDATLNQQVSDDMPVEQHKRPPFGVDRSESMEDPRIGMRGVMTYTAGKTPPQARQVDASPLARSEPM